MKTIKHIRVPLTIVSVIAMAILVSAAVMTSSVKVAAPTATTLAASNVLIISCAPGNSGAIVIRRR